MPVPRDRVEIVRWLAERWNAGIRVVPTEHFDPAVELESPFSSVVGEAYVGYAGIEQWQRDLDEQFAEWRLHLDEVRETGDAVIAIGGAHARGRGSGIEFDTPAVLIAQFGADDRIVRARIHSDVKAALDSLGPSE